MSAWVLDTSAILAYLVQETGADRIEGMIEDGAAVSTMIVQETMSKLVQLGMPHDAAEEAIASVGLNVHDVTFALAIEAGAMFPFTKPFGLSHGDRACLALGRTLDVPVATADKQWSKAENELGVRVEQFR